MNSHRLSPTLSLYVARQFALAFLAVLGVVVFLIVLFETIELMRRTVTIEGATFGSVIGMALLKLPHTVGETLPFVVLIAATFALFRLARSHELVVMRAAGVSVWHLLALPLTLAGLLGLVNLFVFNPIAAELYDVQQRREDAITGATLALGEGGLWLREVRGDEAAILHATEVHQTDSVISLRKISIFVTDNSEHLERRYEAAQGEIAGGEIKLASVWEMAPGDMPRFHEHLSIPSNITPQKVEASFAPDSMSVWTLPQFIAFSEQSGFSAVPHRLRWHALIASPMVLVTMLLLAAAICVSAQTRFGTWVVRGLAALGAGFLFYFLNQFTYALGGSTTLPVMFAAWAPTLIAALLGTTYLLHREDG